MTLFDTIVWYDTYKNEYKRGKCGNYHCYNVVPLPEGGECVFDLTSEQFGEEKLCYEGNPEQFREVHFAREEKHLRYNFLRAELLKKLEEI